MKPRLTGPSLLVVIGLLFLVANRAAYKGFFMDDDLDTLAWTHYAGVADYLIGLVSPKLSASNFRPVGHGFYKILETAADLHFKTYVGAIQVLHLVTALLVWWLLRGLGFEVWPAAAALVFFTFHPATFAAYWQTMYVFDLLCGLLSVACVLLYMRRQWVLSFLCLWLAFKAKEIAIMLPVALAAYEFLLGERRWKRVAPFFAVPCLFGVQAMLHRHPAGNNYRLELSAGALAKTVPFYLAQVFRNAVAGALALLVPIALRDPRAWFGAAAAVAVMVPLLALPGRMFGVYSYAAMPFVAVLLASIASYSRVTRVAIPAAIALLWVPMTYAAMRDYRRWALTAGMDNRTYVEQAASFMRSHPEIRSFLVDGRPENMNHWGPPGAVHSINADPHIHVAAVGTLEGDELLKDRNPAHLRWDYAHRSLDITTRDSHTANAAFLDVVRGQPFWQLGTGWYWAESFFRWAAPAATAVLSRPAGTRFFELTVNVGEAQLKRVGPVSVTVSADGRPVGTAAFDRPGVQTARWTVHDPSAPAVAIELRTLTPLPKDEDPRGLGVAVCSFGYRAQ